MASQLVKSIIGYKNQNQNQYQLLSSYTKIRIIITGAAGFGNQRSALTLMHKLRLLGFGGLFDIRYRDIYPPEMTPWLYTQWVLDNDKPYVEKGRKSVGFNGRVLSTLIPEFIPDIDYDQEPKSYNIVSNSFGSIVITRLPNRPIQLIQSVQSTYSSNYNLPKIELTMCAADDSICLIDKNSALQILDNFNTRIFCSFVPTDWYNGEQFIIKKDVNKILFIKQNASYRYRLSAEQLIPYVLTKYENQIIKLISDKNCMSQLVYGLNNIKYFLPINKVVRNLISVYKSSPIIESGYIILLFTQDVFNKLQYMDNVIMITNRELVSKIDNWVPEITSPPTIYLVHIGKLNPGFFDDLMINLTNLPPVIVGANSIELCETHGRLYLHSSKMGYKINDYGKTKYEQLLNLHKDACLPLESDSYNFSAMIEKTNLFLKLFKNKLLTNYAKQRKLEHEQRPDCVINALDKLKIRYNISII